MLPEDSNVRKFQVIYPAKDFFFPNYLFCVILQGEHVLSIYVQNVISAFYLFVHEQVTNTNVLQLATLWLLLYYLKQKNKNKKSP